MGAASEPPVPVNRRRRYQTRFMRSDGRERPFERRSGGEPTARGAQGSHGMARVERRGRGSSETTAWSGLVDVADERRGRRLRTPPAPEPGRGVDPRATAPPHETAPWASRGLALSHEILPERGESSGERALRDADAVGGRAPPVEQAQANLRRPAPREKGGRGHPAALRDGLTTPPQSSPAEVVSFGGGGGPLFVEASWSGRPCADDRVKVGQAAVGRGPMAARGPTSPTGRSR